MRLLATSKGMFTQEEMVPDTRPMVNFLRNSSVGSWANNKKSNGGWGLKKETLLLRHHGGTKPSRAGNNGSRVF